MRRICLACGSSGRSRAQAGVLSRTTCTLRHVGGVLLTGALIIAINYASTSHKEGRSLVIAV